MDSKSIGPVPGSVKRFGPTSKSPNQRDRILDALRAAGRRGLTTPEVLKVGGFRYSSRLRELRIQGNTISCKSLGESLFLYTLESEAERAEPPFDYSADMEKHLRDSAMPLFKEVR